MLRKEYYDRYENNKLVRSSVIIDKTRFKEIKFIKIKLNSPHNCFSFSNIIPDHHDDRGNDLSNHII